MRRVPIRGQAKQLKLRAMPADSDTKSGPVPGPVTPLQIETADGRAPSASAPVSVPRPLLGEIAARLAQAVRGLRRDSTMRESLEEVIEESERETQDFIADVELFLRAECEVEDGCTPVGFEGSFGRVLDPDRPEVAARRTQCLRRTTS